MAEDVLLEMDGAVARVTLNRPDKLNALSPALLKLLAAKLDEVAASPARALLLTGAGRAFCAGGNLKGIRTRNGIGPLEQPDSTRWNYRRGVGRIARAFMDCETPLIAAVIGAALLAFLRARIHHAPDRIAAAMRWLPRVVGTGAAVLAAYALTLWGAPGRPGPGRGAPFGWPGWPQGRGGCAGGCWVGGDGCDTGRGGVCLGRSRSPPPFPCPLPALPASLSLSSPLPPPQGP